MILDERYDHPAKARIAVNVDWDAQGNLYPKYFWIPLPDGEVIRYKVEHSLPPVNKVSYRYGIGGKRYAVQARAVCAHDDEDYNTDAPDVRVTALFLDDSKWYIAIGARGGVGGEAEMED